MLAPARDFRLWLLASSAIAMAAVLAYPAQMMRLSQEDHTIEWLTALLYLAAALGCWLRAARGRDGRRIGRRAWALLFLLVAAEELSWGQRIFHFATPVGLQRVSLHQELNLHDLAGIREHVWMLAVCFILFSCFLAPWLARRSGRLRAPAARLRLPPFPPHAQCALAIGIASMAIPRVAELPLEQYVMDETGELYLAAGFTLFSFDARAWRPHPQAPRACASGSAAHG